MAEALLPEKEHQGRTAIRPHLFHRRSIDQLEIENLAIILTDECNFACSYCYQARGAARLEASTLIRAIDLFRPYFGRQCVVSFYGGEPLLAFDLIQKAVLEVNTLAHGNGKGPRFSLITNGSLLNDDILEFLARHEFKIELSFDGLAQDISRGKGSSELLLSAIHRILSEPRLSLETNSVFTSETVGLVSESVELLVKLGVPKLDINFGHKPPWTPAALRRLEEEVDRVGEFFLSRYEDVRDVPWSDFLERPDRAIRYCPAGADRMAVSALGAVWGCAVFAHHSEGKDGMSPSREYCFGDIETFAENPREVYAERIVNYSTLRMDLFSTPNGSCLMCDEVESCWICPIAAGWTSGEIGMISSVNCQRARILRHGKRRFLERFDGLGRRS